jgi:FkbM family methyltransferase
VIGERADIHSFEPSSRIFAQLADRCRDVAHLNNFGLSDRDVQLTLYTNPERSGLSSVYERKLDHIDLHLAPSETVQMHVLDDYRREQAIDRIDLLKLDVEGHELAVLRGAKETLDAGKVDFIQFEFGGCNIDSRTFFQDFYYLLVPRYRIYRILADGLWPIIRYDESLEAFTTTNYLAVRSGVEFAA